MNRFPSLMIVAALALAACGPTDPPLTKTDNNKTTPMDMGGMETTPDMSAPEGCETTEADETTCDGEDNDCDGQVDEGCPNCKFDGEMCTSDGECCYGSCRDGLCQPACRPEGVECFEDYDCCGGTCARAQGEEKGVCIAG